jgi:hypothetical protein
VQWNAGRSAYLLKPNLLSILAEALAADVQTILADETGLVGAVSARKVICMSPHSSYAHSRGQDGMMLRQDHIMCNLPLTSTLAVLAGTREPNSVVCHFCRGLR